jgi:hypothetical protein
MAGVGNGIYNYAIPLAVKLFRKYIGQELLYWFGNYYDSVLGFIEL